MTIIHTNFKKNVNFGTRCTQICTYNIIYSNKSTCGLRVMHIITVSIVGIHALCHMTLSPGHMTCAGLWARTWRKLMSLIVSCRALPRERIIHQAQVHLWRPSQLVFLDHSFIHVFLFALTNLFACLTFHSVLLVCT